VALRDLPAYPQPWNSGDQSTSLPFIRKRYLCLIVVVLVLIVVDVARISIFFFALFDHCTHPCVLIDDFLRNAGARLSTELIDPRTPR
jgi:hypothetical protein